MLKEKTNFVLIDYTTYIRIPAQLLKDSQFPFSKDDELVIRIDPKGKRLIIEKE